MDGGLDIPHSEKRFAGYGKESKQFDAEVHRKYIYGGHVAAYMRVWICVLCHASYSRSLPFLERFAISDISFNCSSFNLLKIVLIVCLLTWYQTLMEDEPEKYQSHYSEYIKREIEPDDLEELYKKVHAAIRAEPCMKKVKKQPPKQHKRWGIYCCFLVCVCVYICVCTCICTELVASFHYVFFFIYMCTSSWENLWWYSDQIQLFSCLVVLLQYSQLQNLEFCLTLNIMIF